MLQDIKMMIKSLQASGFNKEEIIINLGISEDALNKLLEQPPELKKIEKQDNSNSKSPKKEDVISPSNLKDLPDGDFSLNFSDVPANELDANKIKEVEQSISAIVRLLNTVGKTDGTFTDVLNEFLAYESIPVKMTTGKGLSYMIEAWKNLNKKYGKKGTPVFEKGEIQSIQDKFKTLMQNSNSVQEALEKRRIEGIKESTATIDPTQENVGNKTKKSDQVKLDQEANKDNIEKVNPKAVKKDDKGIAVKETKEAKKGQAPRLD
ncbi:hypothetical protein [Psychroflexus planctonicus]|uniref:Uncharacterized protein n=1 Tax=Psychroflexus planctonicus TaxID=1526575 RepID=A0ABQ1SCV3_9FLAO|nr:hypothetical protein [Psychroflexus planctonicus]GGE27357.1 hypothetical protein GCM10010832_05070 [Psychroflexus planctonicus]